MVINPSNSFRRYTPPTCTLEMYNPQPFWGKWRYQSFPEYFSFQLHFDDPRLPQENRNSLLGDRILLEKLRKEVDEYVREYLHETKMKGENLKCDLPTTEVGEFICVSRQSAYSHCVYYRSGQSEKDTITINLTNTQLLDLVNALEAYYYDARKTLEISEEIKGNLGWGIVITTLLTVAGGGLWWRYEEKMTRNEIPSNASREEINQPIENNIEKVVPPSPLNRQNLPKEITPEVPSEIKNRESMSPPILVSLPSPPTNTMTELTQQDNLTLNIPLPPEGGSNNSSELIIEPNITDNNNTISTLPTPSTSSVSSTLPTPPMLSTAPTSPKPPISSTPPTPPRLSQLPTLSPSKLNQGEKNVMASDNNKIIDNLASSPTITENNPSDYISSLATNNISRLNFTDTKGNSINISSLQPKTKANTNISEAVKDYFRQRWQPPENLNQSIEYRLKLNANGDLTQITPIGQTAIIFLDKTKMPLLGEKFIVSMSEDSLPSEVTIRLILSPNGNVQTFQENQKQDKG